MTAKDEEQSRYVSGIKCYIMTCYTHDLHSCAGELQEALEAIEELTANLNEATQSNQELVEKNESLQEELQALRDEHDELIKQANELDKMIKEEREKSIGVVQDQLQREHELSRQIDAANHEILSLIHI